MILCLNNKSKENYMFKFLKSLFSPKKEVVKPEHWPFPTSKVAESNPAPVAPYKIEPSVKVIEAIVPKANKPKQVNKPKANKPKQIKSATDKAGTSKKKKAEVKIVKPAVVKAKPTNSKKPPKVSS